MARQPKRRPWVRRVIQRVRFTGREPRRLMWRKAIYEEWFEYAKLAGTYPKEFGDLSKYEKFDDWWRDPSYGFELFCEPPDEPVVEEVTGTNAEGNRLIVSIKRDSDPYEVIHHLKKLVEMNVRLPRKDVSHARFTPSKPAKNLMPEKLERYRLVYALKKDHSRLEIAYLLRNRKSSHKNSREQVRQYFYGIQKSGVDKGSPRLPDEREISRDLQKARAILKRVERGVFP